jgi:iron complex outermembrane receptor protein
MIRPPFAYLAGRVAFASLGWILLAASWAGAQDGPVEVDPWAGIEEMVVTGEASVLVGQAETTSVLGFDSADLVESRITDIGSLAEYTPNLEIKTGASSVSSPTIFIRGIGLLDFNSNASSSVAIYNDGVYMNSPIGQLFQFFDLAGVEVLRGPQGTINARNATAGAIRITPKKPDGAWSANSSVTYGNYDTLDIEGALGIPIVPDLLSARIAAKFSTADGYTENRCAKSWQREPPDGTCVRVPGNEAFFGPVKDVDSRVNNTDNWAGRFQLRLQPTDDQDWILNFSGGQSKALAYQFQSRGTGVGANDDGIGSDSRDYRDADRDPFAGDYDLVREEKLNILGVTLNGEIDYDFASLRTTTGYARATDHAPRNFDASPNQVAHAYADSEVWQVSEEISLVSDSAGRLSWEAGGFFLAEHLDSNTDLLEGVVLTAQLQSFEQRLATWALFFKGGFELTETLTLEGGIRYNWERKEFDLEVLGLPSRIPDAPVRENVAAQDDKVWDEPTGEIVLTWKPIEDVSVYGKYTHGFKGGHFNGGAFFSAQSIEAVKPEKIDAFEVGLKSEWIDGMLTLNLAAWYYDYKNYQVFVVQNAGGAFPLPQILNAPRVESRGIELDATVRPVEGFELGVSMAVLDAEFTDFTVARLKYVTQCPTPPFPACPPEQEVLDFSGNPLVAAPDVSVNLRASYEFPLGALGRLTPRLDASFRSKTYFVPGNQSELTLGQGAYSKNEGASQAPYWLLNARLAYTTPNDLIELAFWVRNLTDEVYLNNSLDTTNGLQKFLDVYGPPRTWGFTGAFRW